MRAGRTRSVTVVAAGLAAAFLLAFFVSPHASSSPDGLEKVAAAKGLDTDTTAHVFEDGPLADYAVTGVDDPSLGVGLAGIIGVAATFVVMTGLLYGLRRVRASSSPPTTPPAPGHPARA